MTSGPDTILEVRNLSVRRGQRTVLHIDHLAVEENEVLALIGPNGAGKSTLLLALSQLIRPANGQILFHGHPLLPRDGLAYRRKIGLVLQDPLLMDTSVYENTAAGLRFRRLPEKEIKPRVELWLEKLGIAHLSWRPAHSLSGGEAQRASLARAFALQPEVLLLDEPFSALDAPTRARLLEDFQSLIAETPVTTVFVTHDLDEALLLGKRVAVIIAGRLRQVGRPDEIFNTPEDEEIAAFVGVETVIPGQVSAVQDGLLLVKAGAATLEAVGEAEVGRPVLICLRPEDVTLWTDGPARTPGLHSSARNRLAGVISKTTPQGALVRVVVDCGFPLVALVTRTSANEMGLAPGKAVTATFKASAIHLIRR
jgi:tungstate transport system ATP-binding protein